MRVLLDTNVLVAAFLSRGNCAGVLKRCNEKHDLVTSEALLKELYGVLIRKARCPSEQALRAVALLARHMAVLDPEPLQERVCRDPDDDAVLAAALAGKCDCIVTGDKDLLDLERFEGIPIISPSAFWRYEANCPG